MYKFLVEIRLKDWVVNLKNGSRVLGYEEVMAWDEITSRMKGFDNFMVRAKYEPKIKKLMNENNLSKYEICAPDSVKLC